MESPLGTLSIVHTDVLGLIFAYNGIVVRMARLNRSWYAKLRQRLLAKANLPIIQEEVDAFWAVPPRIHTQEWNELDGHLAGYHVRIALKRCKENVGRVISGIEELQEHRRIRSVIGEDGLVCWRVKTTMVQGEERQHISRVVTAVPIQSINTMPSHSLIVPIHVLVGAFSLRGGCVANERYAERMASIHVKQQLEWLWSKYASSTFEHFLSFKWYTVVEYSFHTNDIPFFSQQHARDCYLVFSLYLRVVFGVDKSTNRVLGNQTSAVRFWYLATDFVHELAYLEEGDTWPKGNPGSESESEGDEEDPPPALQYD